MSSQKKFLPKLYPSSQKIEEGKLWFVQYTGLNGKPQKLYGQLNKLPTVEQRLAEAQVLIAKAYADTARQPGKGGGSNELLSDLSQVVSQRSKNVKSKTATTYEGQLLAFATWYRSAKCPPMTPLVAAQFLDSLLETVTPCTRNGYRRNLTSFFGDLVRFYKPRYTENPFKETRKMKEASHTKQWFRPDMVAQLKVEIPAAKPSLWLACWIQHDCFVRPDEIRGLRVDDINFTTGKLRVVGTIAKTKKIRYVPIPADLLEALRFYMQVPGNHYLFTTKGGPGARKLGQNTLGEWHRQIMRALGYPDGFTFYSWKNTGAVKMLCMDRRPMKYISKCMGHHSMEMTDKYFESLGVDEMGEVILFPLLSTKKPAVETAGDQN